MTSPLASFRERASEAERRLAELENQINSLVSRSSASKSKSAVQPEAGAGADVDDGSVDSKNDEEEAPFEFYYWPAKSRGNFVRLIFEECNVPYTVIEDRDAVSQSIRSDRYGKQTYDAGGFYQAMAPPFIKKGEFVMAQSVEICGYLSSKFGLRPKCNDDNALAQMLVANCSDAISDLYKHRSDSAEDLLAFVNGRFQLWLDILQKPLTQSEDQLYYFENRCTQADLIAFNLLDGFEELFQEGAFNKYIGDTHPALVALYRRVAKRESVVRLMEKQSALFSYNIAHGWGPVRKALNDSLTETTADANANVAAVTEAPAAEEAAAEEPAAAEETSNAT